MHVASALCYIGGQKRNERRESDDRITNQEGRAPVARILGHRPRRPPKMFDAALEIMILQMCPARKAGHGLRLNYA